MHWLCCRNLVRVWCSSAVVEWVRPKLAHYVHKELLQSNFKNLPESFFQAATHNSLDHHNNLWRNIVRGTTDPEIANPAWLWDSRPRMHLNWSLPMPMNEQAELIRFFSFTFHAVGVTFLFRFDKIGPKFTQPLLSKFDWLLSTQCLLFWFSFLCFKLSWTFIWHLIIQRKPLFLKLQQRHLEAIYEKLRRGCVNFGLILLNLRSDLFSGNPLEKWLQWSEKWVHFGSWLPSAQLIPPDFFIPRLPTVSVPFLEGWNTQMK